MTFKALSPNVSASPQIRAEDIPAAVEHGFRSLICNRPDGEAPDQPDWSEVAAAAKTAGLATAHIPVTPSGIDADSVARFAAALEAMPKPVLAFCGTGMRSASLWALSNNGSLTAEERIRTGARAGYNLEPLRQRMDG